MIMTVKTKKYQIRLSKILDSLPSWLKPVTILFTYLLIYIVGIVCFCSFAWIIYEAYLVIFGTEPFPCCCGLNKLDTISELYIFAFVSIVSFVMYLHVIRKKLWISIGLFISFFIAIFYAIEENTELDVSELLHEDMLFAYGIFICSLFILLKLVPNLLHKLPIVTRPFAIPVKLKED